ncbi:hypothetical protein Pa4123_09160 [Phytohabitans aurantiacus]|uniref:Uncharacterized protein n=1 Tax=Phytohabitans aurantiacus TaxID=3016789 RepID=A0ABQ5QN28_9ACTN|nr:hypothetical protein Pa4123_09160 [Phytohabitans aurantiacus]
MVATSTAGGLRAIDADLEPPGHVTMHHFPIAPAREAMRWSASDSGKDCRQLGTYGDRAGTEEVAARDGLERIVVAMPAEVDDVVGVFATRADSDGSFRHSRGP